jgi:anti-sigma28 factor (negative regulator of flagellin synthesis)
MHAPRPNCRCQGPRGRCEAAAAWAVVQSLSATSHAMPTKQNETPAPSSKSQKASAGLTTAEEHEEMDLEHRQDQMKDREHDESGEERVEEIGDEN